MSKTIKIWGILYFIICYSCY